MGLSSSFYSQATIAWILLFGNYYCAEITTAFVTPKPYLSRNVGNNFLVADDGASPTVVVGRTSFVQAKYDDIDDNIDDEDDDDDDEEEEEDGLESLQGKKLGINLGAELPSLSQDEIDDIRVQVQAKLDEVVDERLADIEQLREQMQDDLERSRERMQTASKLNAQMAKQNLMEKIDQLSNDFLAANAEARRETKAAANADAASSGRGVDWGSWGAVGGLDVVLSGSNERGDRQTKLLGSVDSAKMRTASDLPANTYEDRVLVILDDKQSKGSKQIMERLCALLDTAFDSKITVDQYSPTSNVPMGGNNAQTALIFASSLNDRSSLENIVGRILKRTAPVAGGAPSSPPSHIVIVSCLGTERTNLMPYSVQNFFGGKIDKQREIENAVIAIARNRIQGRQLPLDYTIVKFGDIAPADDENVDVKMKPGDALDGDIGPNAAANVLLQAMAYQPYARNSTLCAVGNLPIGAPMDAAVWNDKFLRLSGPELLRIDAGRGSDVNSDNPQQLDTKFEQLLQYVKEWSSSYEGSRKGTGLTTPVLVRKSRKLSSNFDGVVAREGVRLLFQPTNTGDRYKSASEERQLEEQQGRRSSTTKKSSTTNPVAMSKTRKEGGIEVLVEKTTGGDIRVRARRCNMDEKTIVKEMSEEVIVKSLKRAIEAWVKARGVTGF